MTTWLADIQVTLRDENAEVGEIMMFGSDASFHYRNEPSGTVSVRVVHDDTREAFAVALEQAARLVRLGGS